MEQNQETIRDRKVPRIVPYIHFRLANTTLNSLPYTVQHQASLYFRTHLLHEHKDKRNPTKKGSVNIT